MIRGRRLCIVVCAVVSIGAIALLVLSMFVTRARWTTGDYDRSLCAWVLWTGTLIVVVQSVVLALTLRSGSGRRRVHAIENRRRRSLPTVAAQTTARRVHDRVLSAVAVRSRALASATISITTASNPSRRIGFSTTMAAPALRNASWRRA